MVACVNAMVPVCAGAGKILGWENTVAEKISETKSSRFFMLINYVTNVMGLSIE
jgi:hypothetical protein